MQQSRERIRDYIANKQFRKAFDELCQIIERAPTVSNYSFMLSCMSKLDLNTLGLCQMKIAILSSFTIAPVVTSLKAKCYQSKMNPQIYVGGYNQFHQEVLDPKSELYRFNPDVLILAIRLEELSPKLMDSFLELDAKEVESISNATVETIYSLVSRFREYSKAMVILHNFAVPIRPELGILDSKEECSQIATIRAINTKICQMAQNMADVYLLDYDHLTSLHGKLSWQDEDMWLLASMPISGKHLPHLADEYMRYLKPLKGLGRKCIVLDLDNTLWGGIIGEDGIDGIQIGQTYPGNAFLNFQKELLKKYNKGFLLAINSKNNRDDVIEVFAHHPDMILREKHFVATRINWQDKIQNMKEIANELNIGLDSLVFIDDNPVERELMKRALPEVLTIELPEKPAHYCSVLRELTDLETLTFSEEDKKRSQLYQEEKHRDEVRTASASLEEFYETLGMEAIISCADSYSIPRIAQLTQKTNQFNLTTRRYTENQISEFSRSSSYGVFYLQLKDKFGDYGLVGVALTNKEGKLWKIDSFLLSCRVIGRGVESVFLSFIVDRARKEGATYLYGSYIPTKKNSLVSHFYEQHKFELIKENSGVTEWGLDIENQEIEPPFWIKLTEGK